MREAAADAWEELGERPVPVQAAVPIGVAVRPTATGWTARVVLGGAPIHVSARTREAAIRGAERAAGRALGRFISDTVRTAG